MGLFRKLRKKRSASRYGWSGNYPDWQAAAAHTGGYDQANILERVRAATRAVNAGKAVFERDSVLFDAPHYNWPLLAAINWVAARNGGRLRVLDFGGALGSTWFQNRIFFDHLDTAWTVVEQPHFVAAGRAEFSGNGLEFAASIDEAVTHGKVDLFLASSVLQYLEDPAGVLAELRRHRFDFALFDRTAVTTRQHSRITIQRVPESIYAASYPARFLCHNDFLGMLETDYRLVTEWPAMFDKTDLEDCGFRGALLEIKQG
jgi:putative methyltransferase (TIGR04325 family)